MTAAEEWNLIDWLREQGFDNERIVDCIETVEGKKKLGEEKETLLTGKGNL